MRPRDVYRRKSVQTRSDGEQERGRRTPLDHPEVEDLKTFVRVEEPDRYAGYRLLDPLGQRIGKVERVFASGRGEPQYVRVTVGWMRSKMLVIPTERVAVDEALQTPTLL